MEGKDSLLDVIYEEDNLEGIDDVEMLDVEEGELVEPNLHNEKGQSSGGDVDAIQACGDQMTAYGSRCRNGGGILWNIIKAEEPKAYKEIMKKVQEFEKQFKPPNNRRGGEPKKEGVSPGTTHSFVEASVRDSLRIPVSSDDDLLGEDTKGDAA
ncbi:hypothetical protein RGQ29_018786 [Quercus rubra]|uniref:Phosphorylated adapter RNA export protein n=1 Tax=Quercus rubra TaxID=3512 RepID=A0AAN7FR00_QUERU|nr:hypothetical protein RGQ29_018786 [Quercus rubra]